MAINAHIATEKPTAANRPTRRLDRLVGRVSLSPAGGFITPPSTPPAQRLLAEPNQGPYPRCIAQ